VAIKMGLREANQKFSKAIKAVRAGQEVVLTDRGRAIAVIHPLVERSDPEAIIEQLRARGFLRAPASSGPMRSWKPRPVRGEAVAKSLQKERSER
jgi:prevent-host-death family protein